MTGKKFERTTPEAVGISSKSLEQLIENLERVTEMHGIMIMRHEKICAEGWWAPYAPGIRHSLHSLSKTYSATAIGIAVTEGKVFLDEKILSIFPEKAPENPDENLKQLTVKDILCMGSGMERLPEVTGNWLQAYLEVPIKHPSRNCVSIQQCGIHPSLRHRREKNGNSCRGIFKKQAV